MSLNSYLNLAKSGKIKGIYLFLKWDQAQNSFPGILEPANFSEIIRIQTSMQRLNRVSIVFHDKNEEEKLISQCKGREKVANFHENFQK